MLDFDFMHVVESSLGLTIGSLLARAIGRACERSCTNPEVQQIDRDSKEDDYDHEPSDSPCGKSAEADNESVHSIAEPMILQEYNASETRSHHEGGC